MARPDQWGTNSLGKVHEAVNRGWVETKKMGREKHYHAVFEQLDNLLDQ